MSRFSALDLNALPDPSGVGLLDYGDILEARFQQLEATLSGVFAPEKVAEIMGLARNIGSSPMRYLNEAAAARELYLGNRINEAIRSVLLATARGPDLDQLGAGRGVVRKVLDDSDPDAVLFEDDDTLRGRIQLAIEAWSPHGTEGSYVYWALEADNRVRDVAVYGPNHGLDPAVPAAEAHMVVLSTESDGTATQELQDIVFANCTTDRRRPVADRLVMFSAEPVPYQIEAVLHVTTPETASLVEAAAQAAAQAFVAERIAIGRSIYRSSIAAALNVDGVVDVELIAPAVDVEIGPFEASHCTSILLSQTSYTGGWRNV